MDSRRINAGPHSITSAQSGAVSMTAAAPVSYSGILETLVKYECLVVSVAKERAVQVRILPLTQPDPAVPGNINNNTIMENTFHENLPVTLTREELLHRGNTLAEMMQEISDLEEAKKSIAADFKIKIDTKSSEATVLAGNIRAKSEIRLVECVERHDYDARKVFTVRLDTGEVINSRPMEIGDMQESMIEPDERHTGKIAYLGEARP